MARTTVVNLHKESYDVYIGRPSIFGNPFVIGKDGDRKEVIEKYKHHFIKEILTNPYFVSELEKLRGKKLGCYCSPQECHGDVIANFLNLEKKL